MALPQQVLERLSREPPQTPGWSFGLLFFSGALLFIALLAYFGLTLGYEPYLNNQIDGITTQINTLAKSVAPNDQAQLVSFYSEITNLQQVLRNHVTLSPFFAWLEKNTEANVYYTSFSLSGGNRISIGGYGATEADVNQQVAIFEAAPEVRSAQLSSVTLSPQTGNWQFSMTLLMNNITSSTTP